MNQKPDRPRIHQSPRVIVIGVGNFLLKDEGIGIHIAYALQKLELPPNVSILDGGTSPDLIACSEAGARLIIIDAARAGGKPGTVYRFHPADLEVNEALSAHEIGVVSSLKLMTLTGNAPGEVIIIGVEPGEIDPGTEPSAGLQAKIPEIVDVVLREIGIKP